MAKRKIKKLEEKSGSNRKIGSKNNEKPETKKQETFNLKKEIEDLKINETLKNKLISFLKEIQEKEKNLSVIEEKFTKIISSILNIEKDIDQIDFKNQKEKQEFYNVFFELLINSNYNEELVLNIIKNAKENMNYNLFSLLKVLNKPDYDKEYHQELILNIIKNAKENIFYAFDSFFNLIGDLNYDKEYHQELILNITKEAKENIFHVLNSFLKALNNENFSKKEILDFFDINLENNFWTLYKNILKKEERSHALNSLSKIIGNSNYEQKKHYELLLSITNGESQEIKVKLNSFL